MNKMVLSCLLIFLCLLLLPLEIFAAAGDLDTTFHTPSGSITVSYPASTMNVVNGMAYQTDGKIVCTGYTGVSGSVRTLLFRLTSAGSLDTSFGTSGYVISEISGSFANSVSIQKDGKIVVAGYVYEAGVNKAAVWRFNGNGTADTGFGSGGLAKLTSNSAGYAVTIQTDGGIVVAGQSTSHAMLVRFTSSGSLDTLFGSNGVVTVTGGFTVSSSAAALALQQDGKIVIVGTGSDNNANMQFVSRYNSNGSIDSSFGTAGISVYSGTSNDAQGTSIALLGDDIIVGGYNTNGAVILRYSGSGSLNNTFGTAGVYTYAGSNGTAINALAVQANGKIVAVGTLKTGSLTDILLLRLTSNGGLDTDFSNDGVTNGYTIIGSGLFNDNGRAVIIQPDGKIVLAGGYNSGTLGFVSRYLPAYYAVTKTISGSGTVECSPDPVPEGTATSCTLTPGPGNYLSSLSVGFDMLSMMIWDPVLTFTEQVNYSSLIVMPTFSSATIGLYTSGSLLSGKTENNFADAFGDCLVTPFYDEIRVLSGGYYDSNGIVCSASYHNTPILITGEWMNFSERGTWATVLSPSLTISGSCHLEVDGITIQ